MYKLKKIIFLMLMIISISFSYSFSYYENGSKEYEKRLQEAEEIINSVNPTNTSTIYDANSDNRTVYVTTNNSKYHVSGCDYLDSAPHSLTVTEAESKGYAPCKVCNPYGLVINEEENDSNNKIIFILVTALIVLIIYIIFNEKKYKKNKMEK